MKRPLFVLPALLFLQLICVTVRSQSNCIDFYGSIEAQGGFAPMFPFSPSHDAPANITNVKTWQGVSLLPAGASGFVRAKGDRFVDGDGRTIRFLGTNICFSGCFPKHEDADRVAEELARYGINVVRMHYVHHVFPSGKIYPVADSFLEPEQLDRFDYFIAKMKENGIYTYFQLNIARKFGEQNGFLNASRLPFYNNGVDNFDGRMIELQKRFHNEILNHRNKYTGLKYKEEPCISMLELSNENSILHAWFSAKHRMPDIVEPYRTDLMEMWNKFLETEYGDDATLKKAWQEGLSGDGSEHIPEGRFAEDKLPLWGIQNDGMSEGSINLVEASPKDKLEGKYYFSVNVSKVGATPNMPQFYRNGFKFKSMEPFCLKLKMRADRPCSVAVRFAQAHSPWRVLGINSKVELGKKWKEYEFNFNAGMSDDNVRLIISNFTPCTVDVADVSMVSGAEYKWPAGQSLRDASVAWPGRSDWSMPPRRAFDFTEFLSGIEDSYFSHLQQTLKSYIRPAQCVAGTQLHYGLDLPQARMDYCDYHLYWNHPTFRGAWSAEHWFTRKKALVNGDGIPGSNIATASRSRILGKPFTVSEFDHPNMNPYAAEGNVMATAMGAFQNWSGILQFAWTHNTDFYRTMENPMFDMCSAPQKLAHFPACWAMFVRQDVRPGNPGTVYVIEATAKEEMEIIARNQNVVSPAWQNDNLMASLSLAVPSGRVIPEMSSLFNPAGRKVIRSREDIPEEMRQSYDAKEISSNTGELTWNWQIEDAGWFRVDTRDTKAFTGFVRGRSFDYSGMTLTPGRTRMDWLTMTLTNTTPPAEKYPRREVLESGRWLLALTGAVHNTDARIIEISGEQMTFSDTVGGFKGTAPVLCEGIEASLKLNSLAGKVVCRALNASGEPVCEVPVGDDGRGNAIVKVDPRYKTVWYELIVK